MRKIRKAVITAGGWGTRFLPVTKSHPKEMLPLLDRPLIQYSIEDAVGCGAELVVIVTAQGKSAIEDYFDRSLELERMLEQKGEVKLMHKLRRLSDMVDICYVRQTRPLGLGHAVLTARGVIGNEPFIVLLPDDIFEQRELVLQKMLECHSDHGGSVVAVQRVTPPEISRYGIIKPKKIGERVYQVLGLEEKPKLEQAPSDLAIMGRYVLDPEIFAALEQVTPGKGGEIQLTDGLQRLLQDQKLYAYEFEGKRYDAGTPLGWLETTLALAMKDPDIGPGLKQYLKGLLEPG